MARRRVIPLLTTVLLLIGCTPVARALVQARTPGQAPPRISVQIRSGYRSLPATAALLPFADAPRLPGTGAVATDSLRRVLESRGAAVVDAPLPNDGLGRPMPANLAGIPLLARIGARYGADVVVAGRVTDLSAQERGRNYAWVRRPGVEVEVPEERWIETRVSVSLRIIDVRSGWVAFQASGSYGPVRETAPSSATDRLLEEIVGRWLGR